MFQRVRVHDAGADDVHADAARAEFLSERAGERFERGLRRADERVVRNRAQRAEAGEADEHAAICHQRHGLLRERVQREGIRLHAAAPVLEREFHRGLQHADGRIAHHDVHAVELLPEFHKRLREARRIAHIRLHRHRPTAHVADRPADCLRLLVAVEIRNRDITAGTRQLERSRASDAARTAGDECNFAGKSFGHFSEKGAECVGMAGKNQQARGEMRSAEWRSIRSRRREEAGSHFQAAKSMQKEPRNVRRSAKSAAVLVKARALLDVAREDQPALSQARLRRTARLVPSAAIVLGRAFRCGRCARGIFRRGR